MTWKNCRRDTPQNPAAAFLFLACLVLITGCVADKKETCHTCTKRIGNPGMSYVDTRSPVCNQEILEYLVNTGYTCEEIGRGEASGAGMALLGPLGVLDSFDDEYELAETESDCGCDN